MITTLRKQSWQKKRILESRDHQYKAFQEINGLVVRERQGKNIILTDRSELVEFISCSYLGLDQDERLVQAAIKNIHRCGVNFAVARTRMRVESFEVLERLLNKLFCNSYTTTFTSLHIAHLGMLPLLGSGEMPSFPFAKNGPFFILDKTVHSSVQITRGVLNQFGPVVLRKFHPISEVEKQFVYARENGFTPIAIADGVGSMGGLIPVKKLLEFAEQYEGYVYLDDAHGISVYGTHGCGYVLDTLEANFHPRLILAASLSKGFGTNGAVIAVPTKEDEEIVKRFCSPYLFSNPLALAIVDSSIASAHIHLSEEIYALQNKLTDNILYFDKLMEPLHHHQVVNLHINSPIRGIFIGDEFKAIEYATHLKKNGLMVSAAMYPTVAKGNSLLRITISADHSKENIYKLCNHIKQLIYPDQLAKSEVY